MSELLVSAHTKQHLGCTIVLLIVIRSDTIVVRSVTIVVRSGVRGVAIVVASVTIGPCPK